MCARSVIVPTRLLSEEIQQPLILQRQFRAFTRAMTEGSHLNLRNESSGGVVFALLLASHLRSELLVILRIDLLWRVRFRALVALVEVLHFTRASIESTLLVWSDVSSFLFPITHNFSPAFCLLSAQKRSLNGHMSAGASAIQALFTAGWLGIGGHQRFLRNVTYAPPDIKGFSKKPQKKEPQSFISLRRASRALLAAGRGGSASGEPSGPSNGGNSLPSGPISVGSSG